MYVHRAVATCIGATLHSTVSTWAALSAGSGKAVCPETPLLPQLRSRHGHNWSPRTSAWRAMLCRGTAPGSGERAQGVRPVQREGWGGKPWQWPQGCKPGVHSGGFAWEGWQCVFSQPEESKEARIWSKHALTGCWGLAKGSGVVEQPRRTGAAACWPSVPASLTPKLLPAGPFPDTRSHSVRQGREAKEERYRMLS